MIIDSSGFVNALLAVNEWWLSGKWSQNERYVLRRQAFEKLQKELSGSKRVLTLFGPRRVGKSILLHQSIQALLDFGVEPGQITYYSLDDPSILPYTDEPVRDITEHAVSRAKGKTAYVFLDEIQASKNWHQWVKAYYDRGTRIKFVLSGSASFSIQSDANKYLRGRTVEFELLPLDFREFLLFAGVPAAKIGEDDATSAAVVALKAMEPLVEEYLLVGGFPEWFELRGTPDATRRWLERLVLDVPKKAIYEDIASYFGIRNPKVLDLLLTVIASNQGRILSYEKLNEAVRLNRATLLDYLEFLRSSYLLLEIPLHASPKKQAKAMKKFLLCDQGVRNAILKKTVPDPENAGFLVENVVGATLFRHCSQLTYWRDQSNEVDYVADGFPVEVKYQNSIGEPDAAGILRFLKESGGKNGAIITRHHKGKLSIKGKSISLVPFWEFLLDPQQVIMGVWSNPDSSSTKH